jgi:hypothetical protein
MADVRYEEKVSARLAGFVVALVPFAFTMLIFVKIDASVRDIIMVLVGVIAANATQAVQHRFGSSPDSQRKNDTISIMANTAKAAQETLSAVAPIVSNAPPTPGTVTLQPGESVDVKATPESKTPDKDSQP